MKKEQVTDFKEALKTITPLQNEWKDNFYPLVEENRELRKIKIDNEAARQARKIPSDYTIYPIRLIDKNIRAEKPPFVAYMQARHRLAIFMPQQESVNTKELESAFTQGLKYNGWQIPHIRCQDSAALNGFNCVEIVFDPSKPLHYRIDYIPPENIAFNRDISDIEQAAEIHVKIDIAISQLKLWTKSIEEGGRGFNREQVDKIIDKISKNTADEQNKVDPQNNSVISIYKRYVKHDGMVHAAWFHPDCSDWLRDPRPFFNGLVDEDGQEKAEEFYNVKILPYTYEENPLVVESKGRAFLDQDAQAGEMAMWSAYINTAQRASKRYGSVKDAMGNDNKLNRLDNIKLDEDCIYDKPITFWQMNPPDPNMLQAAQMLETQNLTDNGNINFAVNNRKDSRKTASEINQAAGEQAQLSTVSTLAYSIYFRSVYTYIWEHVATRIVSSQLELYYEVGEEIKRLDPSIGNHKFNVYPAGDADVVERAQLIQQMRNDLPLVQGTGVYVEFLKAILAKTYGEEGLRYAQLLGESDQRESQYKQIIVGLRQVVHETLDQEDLKGDPMLSGQIQELMSMSKEILGQ